MNWPKIVRDDLVMLARVLVYSLLVLWVAMIIGLALRLFLWLGFS
jgi:hypothetical protein